MAVLKILKCKSCTRPLDSGVRICPACKTENLIQAEVNPLKMNASMAQEYVEFFKQQKEENPKDTNVLYAMGLFYLGLRNYELAQRNFKEAVDLSPMESDTYYYYALSLIAGQTINKLNYDLAKKSEEWLNTSIGMIRKRKYLILLMLLRQGAYISNGLSFQGEYPSELLADIKGMYPEGGEIEEITDYVGIVDAQNKNFINDIEGKEKTNIQAPTNKSLKINYSNYACPICGTRLTLKSSDTVGCTRCDFQCDKEGFDKNRHIFVCELPKDDDLNVQDVSEERLKELSNSPLREQFFKYLYRPNVPETHKKPFYPLKRYFVRLFKAILFTLLAIFVVGVSNLGNNTLEIPEKDREEMADSITAFVDNHIIVNYELINSEGNKSTHFGQVPEGTNHQQIREYAGIEKSRNGLFCALIMLLPLIIWLLIIIFSILSIIKQRKAIGELNKANKEEYLAGLKKYIERPIVKEIVEFARHFLAKNSKAVEFGDPVQDVIDKHNIDESNLRGNILFLNGFNPEGIEYLPAGEVLNTVFYMIAIPDRDSVLLLPSQWDVWSNELKDGDAVSIYYRNITSVSIIDNTIQIETSSGNTQEIVLPKQQESLLHYQSNNPANELTYSRTRTSDPHEFRSALNKLVEAHHKQN